MAGRVVLLSLSLSLSLSVCVCVCVRACAQLSYVASTSAYASVDQLPGNLK